MDWRKIEYDAVVIGSGATGGMAAKCLTDGGANVLVLEAGVDLPPERRGETDKSRAEFKAFKERQPIQSRSLLYNRKNCHLFIDDLDYPYATDDSTTFNWIRSRQAGGRIPVWSRFAYRMSEDDLVGVNDGAGGTPWPISYRDLAPYYDKVERLIGVSGTSAGVPSQPNGCIVPRRIPSYVRDLQERLARQFPQRHLIPAPQAVKRSVGSCSLRQNNWHAGWVLPQCNPQKLTFRTNCVAVRIELDRPNHAKRVIYIDQETQHWHEVTGRVIVLCASTIESTRLLLESGTREFPTGLGNSSGVLGHYLMDHFGGPRMIAVAKIPDAEPFSAARAFVPRFCNISRRSEDFSRGYGIQASFEADARRNVVLTIGVLGEVLPYADNYIDIDKSTRDASGLAVPRIHFQYRENERKMARHAEATLREIVDTLGFKPMIEHNAMLAAGTRAHELGGVRMGTNPSDSVLNGFNQCWDIENLFVTDGSCFPSAGYKGPTLTMMALTARACDRILDLLRAGN